MKKINQSKDLLLSGKYCPYCGSKSTFVDSSVIYGKSYGMIYLCKPCRAYVGVHKGTKISLGRLADAKLREAKKEAHKYFDLIWNSGKISRVEAYCLLSEYLGTKKEETHIGMFDINMCKKVTEWSKKFLQDKGDSVTNQ